MWRARDGEKPEDTLVFEDAPFAVQNAKESAVWAVVVSVYDKSAGRAAEMFIPADADFKDSGF